MHTQSNTPAMTAQTARDILETLDELTQYAGLSQRQIELKAAAKAALAYWAAQQLVAA